MPGDYPDYPSWRQILDYIRAFADKYDLRKHIRFDTSVDRWSAMAMRGSSISAVRTCAATTA